MRILFSSIILALTALSLRYGEPDSALHVVATAVGLLLALTVVCDHWIERRRGAARRSAVGNGRATNLP